MKKITVILSLLLAAALLALPASADYERIRVYTGQFADVSTEAWYYGNVANAYELGILAGRSASEFAPDEPVTIAETIKLAAVCHQLLTKGVIDPDVFDESEGEHWYDTYISYGYPRGIVTEDYEDYNEKAPRCVVAILFNRALSATGTLPEVINEIEYGGLRDIPDDAWYYYAAYRMYRWGILAGDDKGNINPENSISRAEMSAVVTRTVNPAMRVKIDSGKATAVGTSEVPSGTETPAVTGDSGTTVDPRGWLCLYSGTTSPKEGSLPGFAAEFSIRDGVPVIDASSALEYVNEVIVEKDNISFRLYKNAGYEAFASTRAALEEAAVGANGSAVRSGLDVYTRINELLYLWADGKRMTIAGLWYRDYDEYTVYAFYFDEALDFNTATKYQLVCGAPGGDALRQAGMTELASLVENAYSVVASQTVQEQPEAPVRNELYENAVSAAKLSAVDVQFEYEADRCFILYGEGLYGTGAGDFRLMFIYRDGTSQTIIQQKLDSIRVSSAGKVVYYTLKAADGKTIQYGVNFDD